MSVHIGGTYRFYQVTCIHSIVWTIIVWLNRCLFESLVTKGLLTQTKITSYIERTLSGNRRHCNRLLYILFRKFSRVYCKFRSYNTKMEYFGNESRRRR